MGDRLDLDQVRDYTKFAQSALRGTRVVLGQLQGLDNLHTLLTELADELEHHRDRVAGLEDTLERGGQTHGQATHRIAELEGEVAGLHASMQTGQLVAIHRDHLSLLVGEITGSRDWHYRTTDLDAAVARATAALQLAPPEPVWRRAIDAPHAEPARRRDGELHKVTDAEDGGMRL